MNPLRAEPDEYGQVEVHNPRYDPVGAERETLDLPWLEYGRVIVRRPTRRVRKRGPGTGTRRVSVPYDITLSELALPESANESDEAFVEAVGLAVARALLRAVRPDSAR